VVIEVRVSLAGRAPNENVDLTRLFGKLHLGEGGWRAEAALKERLDLRLSNTGFGQLFPEVLLEGFDNLNILVDGETNLSRVAKPIGSLSEAKCQSAAPAEQIGHA